MTSKVLQVPSVFDGDPIVPSLTFLHIRGQIDTNFTVPKTDSLTVMGVGRTPDALATAILEFISLNAVMYTPEEQLALCKIIADIHQRNNAKQNQA